MDDNLRRAYLQENLGVYLLRGLAAVAEVPRPQDTGVDAVATLLNRQSSRRLIAGRSFYVQIKAASVNDVTYDGDEVKWLRELRLPFFIARVDLQEPRISLYTCHRGLDALTHFNYQNVKLVLSPSPDESEFGAWKTEERIDPLNFKATVWLGPAVLSWTPSDMAKSEFLGNSYRTLEPLLVAMDRNIILQDAGWVDIYKWETGSPPVPCGFGCSTPIFDPATLPPMKTERERQQVMYGRALSAISPNTASYLAAWAFNAIVNGREAHWMALRQILQGYKDKRVQLMLGALDSFFAQNLSGNAGLARLLVGYQTSTK